MHPRWPVAVLAAAIATLPAIVAPAPAADWPGWLGPRQNGSSPEKGFAAAGQVSLGLAWSRDLGPAYSGIAVVGGRAITMHGDGATDWLSAMDSGSGEEIWRYRIGPTHPSVGGAEGGQLSTPVVHRKIVYGLGAGGKLFAVRLTDGSEIWSTDVVAEHGARQPDIGFTTSPVVAGEMLFVQTGGPDGHGLTAFDRKTGSVHWTRGDEEVGCQSPIYTTLAGRRQIVAVTNVSVSGLDAVHGTELWRHPHRLGFTCASPIRLGDNGFVLTGGSESAAFRIERRGGTFRVSELWRGDGLMGSYAMPVLHDGHLYGFDGDFIACVDAATGEQVWMHPTTAGGVILVDGKLVLFTRAGEVLTAPASPAGLTPDARLKVAVKGGETYPSFADGGIFVRNREIIARVNVLR